MTLRSTRTAALLLLAGVVFAARADFEVAGPDGRRILLKDNGTWSYLDAKGKEPAKPAAKEAAKDQPREPNAGEVVLSLESRNGGGSVCRFRVVLANHLPYEIRSLVPTFSAYRPNGVVYDSVAMGFQGLRPGVSQSQEIQFRGIPCEDISRLQVGGGDRCVMGALDRMASTSEECLKLLRVVQSELVRFDK